MSRIMIDHKSLPSHKASTAQAFFSGVAFTIIAAVMLVSILTTSPPVAASVEDHLVSPDMQDFIHKFGRGADLSDQGMQ